MVARILRRERNLSSLYSRFAARWQAGIEYLGFPAAYQHLVEEERRQRRAAGAPERETMLEIGTGSAALSVAYLNANPETKAALLTDNSEDMLKEAAKAVSEHRLNAETRLAALGDTIAEAPFDTVLVGHVIEHTDDPQAALETIRALVAPGGVAILSVSKPHWCTALVRWRWGHKAFHPDAVEAMLKTAGFKDIATVPYVKGPPSRVSSGYIAWCD